MRASLLVMRVIKYLIILLLNVKYCIAPIVKLKSKVDIAAKRDKMIAGAMTWDEALEWRSRLRDENKRVVFTNGVFDIVHVGHLEVLKQSRALGDALIVGLNTDESVRRLKGPLRPILPEDQRAIMLMGLKPVDAVALFDQDTPYELLEVLKPDILVKGGDYTPETVVGRDIVEGSGGVLKIIPLVEGVSSTNVVETVLNRYCKKRI